MSYDSYNIMQIAERQKKDKVIGDMILVQDIKKFRMCIFRSTLIVWRGPPCHMVQKCHENVTKMSHGT